MPRSAASLLAMVALAAAGAAVVAPVPAARAEDPPRPLPFSDDVRPPAPLPLPLDRHLRGKLESFDGERVRISWDWSDAEQLRDFHAFVPVRATVFGGFDLAARPDDAAPGPGTLEGRGTGGLALRLGMKDDLTLRVACTLIDPHDLGVVLPKPDSSDESILCLVQDRFFTRFDAAAGNANMINKMGGIPASAPGHVEFRYIDRKPAPKLDRGDRVEFEVVRSGPETRFTIRTADGQAHVLRGKDTDTAMTRFCPGVYVAGASADFGPLEIEGAFDPVWLAQNSVLPHVASDLLHPGNRFKGAELEAARTVEWFLHPPVLGEKPQRPKKRQVGAEEVAALVGNVKLPLVIRMRAAESLTEKGAEEGSVAERIASLLDAASYEARVLAWQVLRPQLPWHFHYEPDGDPVVRREAALLVADWFRQHEYESADGKVFVEGYWHTPSRADAICAEWAHAWDLRTAHVRVRSNLPLEWTEWYLAALEAQYREMVRIVGRAPPADALPLSVLVFRTAEDYDAFCKAEGYENRVGWGRFTDMDLRASFVTFNRRHAPHWALNQNAKVFLRHATGKFWPTWFDEGRAAWLGSGDYRTATWNGETLTVGGVGTGIEVRMLAERARANRLWSVQEFLERNPRDLEGDERRIWYVYAWALHHYLLTEAPEELRQTFAAWQGVMENLDTNFGTVDKVGRDNFVLYFRPQMAELQAAFARWVATLT